MAINRLRSVPRRKSDLKTAGDAGAEVHSHREAFETRLIEAAAILNHVPLPAALWSRNRRLGVLNDLTRQLVGLWEDDLELTGSLWMDRIHPQDRDSVVAAWNRLQNDETKISCQYRFFPKHKTQEVWLKETSFWYHPRQGGAPAVWSFYTEEVTHKHKDFGETRNVRELLVGLTHEIGNNLQAIRGELDLLTLAGALPEQSSKTVIRGVDQIRKLTAEIAEYVSPPPLQLRSEDLALVLAEVIRVSERQLAEHGIELTVMLREPLPRLRLDWQFRSALKRVIEFSCALLPQGGKLQIEAGLRWVEDDRYVELKLINASPTHLNVEGNDVFRPFLKVNDCRIGLSMAVARQALRRHFGKIAFRQEHRNRGVFSILIKVRPENGLSQPNV
jgi:signal transduction histidine kinase